MTCKCGSPMSKEYDRHRCHICGYSVWHSFQIRRASGAESNAKSFAKRWQA